jgi:hypothetical protein
MGTSIRPINQPINEPYKIDTDQLGLIQFDLTITNSNGKKITFNDEEEFQNGVIKSLSGDDVEIVNIMEGSFDTYMREIPMGEYFISKIYKDDADADFSLQPKNSARHPKQGGRRKTRRVTKRGRKHRRRSSRRN